MFREINEIKTGEKNLYGKTNRQEENYKSIKSDMTLEEATVFWKELFKKN